MKNTKIMTLFLSGLMAFALAGHASMSVSVDSTGSERIIKRPPFNGDGPSGEKRQKPAPYNGDGPSGPRPPVAGGGN